MRFRLDVTAGPAAGRFFELDGIARFCFGRDPDVELSIPDDPEVSRRHFVIEVQQHRYRLIDLRSKNGVFVNGVRFGGRAPLPSGCRAAPDGAKEAVLEDGDEIAAGGTRLRLSIECDAACSRCGRIVPIRARELAATTPSGLRCAECLATAGRERGARALEPTVLAPTVLAQPESPVAGAPTIPSYRLIHEIGRGGMGTVYRALDERNARTVAIKTMLPGGAASDRLARLFQREIALTRQLRHPNIVELLDHGRVGEMLYCVLEFVDGMDFGRFLAWKGAPLDLGEAAPIFLGVLDGLAHAHRARVQTDIGPGRRDYAGVVHRDLKPQNILLARTDGGWMPKVADMGLARVFEAAGLSSITRSGQASGTPPYWPREQTTDYRWLGPPSDVFSVAAVFYEALTGTWIRDGLRELYEQPSGPRSLGEVIGLIQRTPVIPLAERRPEIPAPVCAVFDRALSETNPPRNPRAMRSALADLRFADGGAFRDALGQALVASGVVPEGRG